MSRRLATFLCTALAVSLGGCVVGPDFKAPAPPASERYLPDEKGTQVTPTDAADGPLGASQSFRTNADIAGEWWTLFHAPALDALVRRALADNPTIAGAQAALRQAHEMAAAQIGAYYPQVSGGLTVSRSLTPFESLSPIGNSSSPYYSLTTLSGSVSFMPDVFGLNKRSVESLKAQAENQKYETEATYLTLTSNVVATAMQEASLRAQVKATQDMVGIEQQMTDILRKEFALGQVAQADVRAQESALALTQQTLGPLQKQLAQSRDQLADLVGATPDEAIAQFDLADFTLPSELPLSLPSKLVAQRPDVAAALANLHAASAQVGVAIANRLPQFPLSAQGGSQPDVIGNLFELHTAFWIIVGGSTQPIFDGGTLLHKERGAKDAFDQAGAQYKATVLAALQNVADTLQGLQSDAGTLRSAQAAQSAADDTLRITQGQLQLGGVSYLALLSAQQAELTARLATVQARAARLADTAALFQALGGGWWNRHDIPAPPSSGPF